MGSLSEQSIAMIGHFLDTAVVKWSVNQTVAQTLPSEIVERARVLIL